MRRCVELNVWRDISIHNSTNSVSSTALHRNISPRSLAAPHALMSSPRIVSTKIHQESIPRKSMSCCDVTIAFVHAHSKILQLHRARKHGTIYALLSPPAAWRVALTTSCALRAWCIALTTSCMVHCSHHQLCTACLAAIADGPRTESDCQVIKFR